MSAMFVVALIAVAAWQGWGPFAEWLGGPGHRPLPQKDWILVAEFDGPPDDSTLAAAARSLVSAALDQSEILATVPRDQVRLALQQAGKPTNTRVSAEVARELAYRRAVRAVLEGDVERIGNAYSVVLRVVDAESLKVVVTERGSAKNEDALIPALGRLADKLRRDLGERRSALAATRPMSAVATPSFEAYRLYVRARQMVFTNTIPSRRAAIPTIRDALKLDPDFAGAWQLLGTAYHNLKQPDSSLVAFREALSKPDRLTQTQRLLLEGSMADEQGDVQAALDAYDRILQYDPSNYGALGNRGNPLWMLDRSEEALQSLQRAESASPFGPSAITRSNKAYFLCALGRTDEAREVARRVPGLEGRFWLTYVETCACRWAAAESVAAGVMGDPGVADTRIPSFLASARAGRGAFQEAAASYERAERIAAADANLTYYQNKARRGRLMLTLVSQRAIPVPIDTWSSDTSTATLLTRGLRAAVAGDRAQAQRMLAAARARPKRDLANQGATPLLLEAWLQGGREQWSEIVRLLEPLAQQAPMVHMTYGDGYAAVRWTLAEAYERRQQPDSAAVWLERIVSDRADFDDEAHCYGVVQSTAHQRLVLLYARMGRLDDAQRHLAVLERWWDQPDDVARRMLDDARAAIMSLRAMSQHKG